MPRTGHKHCASGGVEKTALSARYVQNVFVRGLPCASNASRAVRSHKHADARGRRASSDGVAQRLAKAVAALICSASGRQGSMSLWAPLAALECEPFLVKKESLMQRLMSMIAGSLLIAGMAYAASPTPQTQETTLAAPMRVARGDDCERFCYARYRSDIDQCAARFEANNRSIERYRCEDRAENSLRICRRDCR